MAVNLLLEGAIEFTSEEKLIIMRRLVTSKAILSRVLGILKLL